MISARRRGGFGKMRHRSVGVSLAVGLSLAVSATAAADPLNTLFNTGVDDARNALPSQAVDPHYQLIVSADGTYLGPAAYATDPIPSPPWVLNSATSRWITPRPDDSGNVAPGEYVYQLQFDLPGLLPQTASISGLLATDDGGSIRLNGVDKGVVSGGFGSWTPFTLTGDFKPGTNTLEFVVNNGGTAANPSGLRVESMSGSADAPTINLSTAFNQGSATTIPHGSLDDNWVVTAAPAGATLGAAKSIAKNPAWYGHDPDARWIAPQSAASGSSDQPVGVYTYQYDFALSRTGKLFELAGNIGSDNVVQAFKINGTTVAGNLGSFGAPSDLPTVIDQTLFVEGTNTIEVLVDNGGTGPNPHGFQLSAWLDEVAASNAPIADADGPYTVEWYLAEALALDASGSYDLDTGLGDSIVEYAWDLDNNGVWDVTSANPFLSMSQSQYAPYFGGAGSYTFAVKVTDATGLAGIDYGQIDFVPEPATLLFALAGVGLLRSRRRG